MEIIADPITVNCRKVLAGLKLIGADYTLTKVDYFKGEQKSPEIVAINPNAAIPVLRDGDLVLWESNAILQYAADQAGNASAYPDRPEDQGRREPLALVGVRHLVPDLLRPSGRELRQAASGRRDGSVGARR